MTIEFNLHGNYTIKALVIPIVIEWLVNKATYMWVCCSDIINLKKHVAGLKKTTRFIINLVHLTIWKINAGFIVYKKHMSKSLLFC